MGESAEEDVKFFDQSPSADGILGGSVFSDGIRMGEQEKKRLLHRFLSLLEMMQEWSLESFFF